MQWLAPSAAGVPQGGAGRPVSRGNKDLSRFLAPDVNPLLCSVSVASDCQDAVLTNTEANGRAAMAHLEEERHAV